MRRIVLYLMLAALLGACSTRQLALSGAADALAAQGDAPEDDLELARQAAPFYLKLSESVLAAQPDHAGLAAAVSAGFTQYSYAFVAQEAERLEGRDAQAALRARQRAARLYLRGRQHALGALLARQPDLLQRLERGQDPGLRAEQVPLAHWAAASWAGLIALSTDQPERVAELPQVLRLAQAADALAPRHARGALASLLGTLEAARPGGSVARAQACFDRAREAADGREAGVFVAEAEALARQDRARFERLLQTALDTAGRHPSLANEVMRERARWLLDTLEDRF